MTDRQAMIARIAEPLGILVLAIALVPSPLLGSALPPVDRVAFSPASNASIPLDARFVDERGTPVRLGDYLAKRPSLLVPAYYGCSNLCGIVLNAVAAGIASSRLRAGRDVDIVVVSISPLDGPSDALAKMREILGSRAAGQGDGWHFLTGDEKNIAALARALGYRYAFDAADRQFAHAAGLAVVGLEGRVVRVLYGAAFPARDLEQAVTAASTANAAGGDRIAGSSRTWLLCFHYDPHTGRYSFAAMEAVRTAALLALAALVAYAVRAAWREHRSRPHGEDR